MKKIYPVLIISCFLFVHCTNQSTWNDVFHADEAHTGVYRSGAGRGLGPSGGNLKPAAGFFHPRSLRMDLHMSEARIVICMQSGPIQVR